MSDFPVSEAVQQVCPDFAWIAKIGEAHRLDQAGQPDQAILIALDAWESAKRLDDHEGRAACCCFLSDLHRQCGDPIRAEQFFQLAVQSELEEHCPVEKDLSSGLLSLASRRAAAAGETADAVTLLHAASWPTTSLRALVTATDSVGALRWRPGRN